MPEEGRIEQNIEHALLYRIKLSLTVIYIYIYVCVCVYYH